MIVQGGARQGSVVGLEIAAPAVVAAGAPMAWVAWGAAGRALARRGSAPRPRSVRPSGMPARSLSRRDPGAREASVQYPAQTYRIAAYGLLVRDPPGETVGRGKNPPWPLNARLDANQILGRIVAATHQSIPACRGHRPAFIGGFRVSSGWFSYESRTAADSRKRVASTIRRNRRKNCCSDRRWHLNGISRTP